LKPKAVSLILPFLSGVLVKQELILDPLLFPNSLAAISLESYIFINLSSFC